MMSVFVMENFGKETGISVVQTLATGTYLGGRCVCKMFRALSKVQVRAYMPTLGYY